LLVVLTCLLLSTKPGVDYIVMINCKKSYAVVLQETYTAYVIFSAIRLHA
jgi:hypothetical protein